MLRRLVLMVVSAAALTAVWAGQALADTTVGHTGSNNTSCIGNFTLIQTGVASAPGVSYVVPAGSWVATSWSVVTGASGGQGALVVAQPLGGGQYTIVATSATKTLTANSTNTFATSISVQPGDVFGLWVAPGANCAVPTGNGGDTLDRIDSATPPSGTVSRFVGTSNYLVDLSVTLSPPAPVTTVPASVFVCYSKWEQDGGAVFPVDQAEQLLQVGGWLPTAVQGTLAGADNLGGYHLECNPPATLQATGTYVDGGGNVLDGSPGGIGLYAIKTGP